MAKDKAAPVVEVPAKCGKCDGTGCINGGPICRVCDGSGKAVAPAVLAEEQPAFPVPPTLETVIAAGYTPEAAAGIVAQEKAKAAAGYAPYGPNPEPAE